MRPVKIIELFPRRAMYRLLGISVSLDPQWKLCNLYSDPDGHAEGATTFQWYQCTSVGDSGTPISGAESATYVTQPADNNLWLKAEITPVDEHGGVGIPMKSSASRQVGST